MASGPDMKLKKSAMSLSIGLLLVGHIVCRPVAAQGIPTVTPAFAGPTHSALVAGIPVSLSRPTGQQQEASPLTSRLDRSLHAKDEVSGDTTSRHHRSFKRYLVTGLLIGGTAGIVVGAVAARNEKCRDCMVPPIILVPYFAVIGAAGGSVLGGITWLLAEGPGSKNALKNHP